MLRKILSIAVTIMISLVFIGAPLSAEAGNKRKGKYTYRKVYKACQQRGEVEVAKPVLNPDAHTQAEWTQIFETKDFDQFGCKEEWSQLDDTQLEDIYSYLHAHGSDSPTPAKCK